MAKKKKPVLEFSLDEFMLSSGIATKSSADPEAMAILLERAALGFLKSGVPWDLWKQLSVSSKAAFIKANDDLFEERVIQVTTTIVSGIKQALDRFEPKEFGLDAVLEDAVNKIIHREAKRAEGL